MKWWFEKRAPELGAETVVQEQRMRYNPLQGVDPDVLVSAITEFDGGGLGRLARIVETFEKRDDTMRAASRKMLASVSRCAHSVLIVEGEEENPRALEHQKTLVRFWSRVRATSAFSRNAVGGMRLLKRQMAAAQSLGFAVHEIVWRPQADGTIEATFVQVPLEHFENRTGELRFLRRTSDWEGTPMAGGEWMVTVGDGVGIAAAVAAMGKHLSLQDWLLYSERCGQPGLHAKTNASKGSDAWNTLVKSVRNFGREWALVTDPETQLSPISLSAAGSLPYPDLIRRMDQAIAALYRGADLSTISGGTGEVGATLQGEESDILEQDACEMLSETLQEQVDRYVIRYTYGDEEPLAYVQVSPVAHPNLDREMNVDKHLAGMGVRLSKAEALQRYQRTEAETDEDALEAPRPQAPAPGPDGRAAGFANEAGLVAALRNAAETPSAAETDLARALQEDLRPVAERLRDLLQEEGGFAAACKRLRKELPDLLREIGQEESAFAKALEGILAAGDAAAEPPSEKRRAKSEKGTEEALANARGGNPDNRGQFSKVEGPHGQGESKKKEKYKPSAYEPDEAKWPKADFSQPKGVYQQANEDRARNAIDKLMTEKTGSVREAMTSKKLGPVEISYAALEHVESRHGGEAVADISGTLARGEYWTDKDRHGRKQVAVLSKKSNATLFLEQMDDGHWRLCSDYDAGTGKRAMIRKQQKRFENSAREKESEDGQPVLL